MLCIASFIVFLILGIFSTYYRSLAKQAWQCVGKRVTFRPCDTNFADEVKGKLFGRMLFTHPRLARFLEKWVDVFAFLFVVISIWSVASVALTGLNLWVYDTCNPTHPESCSLSGEACAIGVSSLSMQDAWSEGRMLEYLSTPLVTFGETLSKVPNRWKNWDAKEYMSPNPTFLNTYDESKPIALEIIDPSCLYCKKLFEHMTEAGFQGRYNLTYIAYPIPNSDAPGTYKFPRSYLMAQYLEALKDIPVEQGTHSWDWKLLEAIFTENYGKGSLQQQFTSIFTEEEAIAEMHRILLEQGLSEEELILLDERSQSEDIASRIAQHASIVEDQLQTLKIPTLLYDGRRFDRVVDVEQLR